MPDPSGYPSAAEESRAALLTAIGGISLLLLKFLGYYLTGSAAVFSDAMESIANVGASAFALFAIRLAAQPADVRHPYGHGKVEFMSAAIEGLLILLAAGVTLYTSIGLLLHPREMGLPIVGIALMGLATAINGAMGLNLIRLGKKRGSITLESDGKHLLSDAVTSIAAMVALGLVMITGKAWIDPAIALCIAFYIGWIGVQLIRRAYAGLMDEQDIADANLLKHLLDQHIGPTGDLPRICSYHKLRHRHSGRYHWVDFHMVIPAGMTVGQAHDIASNIEYEIERHLGIGDANATAHIEPCSEHDCPVCQQQKSGEVQWPTGVKQD